MLKRHVLAQWSKPAIENPPARSINDWIIVSVLVVSSAVESVIRDDLWLPGLAFVLGVIPVVTLLWRRSDPLAAILVAFSAHAAAEIIPALAGEESINIYSSAAYALLLPYSVFRWGSGRHAILGLLFIIGSHLFAHPLTLADAAFVVVFFLFPSEVGASVRYRVESKARQIEEIKLRERQELARELHDTVAHHVSAIAVRAQAGRLQAGSDPSGALAALDVIELEASRTLNEMRSMVRVLRSGDGVELAPQPGVMELAQLASSSDDEPKITVHIAPDLQATAGPVGTAIYRIAQESVTNSLRHALQPNEIAISVDGDTESVRLSVTDDGEWVGPRSADGPGFGLLGMKERAKLLGGTLEAGPINGKGWRVEATLPRAAPTS